MAGRSGLLDKKLVISFVFSSGDFSAHRVVRRKFCSRERCSNGFAVSDFQKRLIVVSTRMILFVSDRKLKTHENIGESESGFCNNLSISTISPLKSSGLCLGNSLICSFLFPFEYITASLFSS